MEFPFLYFNNWICRYALPISYAFDIRQSYLFGEPTYHTYSASIVRNAASEFEFLQNIGGAFPTLDLTYERMSSDLTYAEVSFFLDMYFFSL